MSIDTYAARHAGQNPVIAEMRCIDGSVYAYRHDGLTIYNTDGTTESATLTSGTAAGMLDRLALLDGTKYAAVLNESCDRCGLEVIADQERALGQGCLDAEEEAAFEWYQAIGYRDGLDVRPTGPADVWFGRRSA